jgi:hypothetical protein
MSNNDVPSNRNHASVSAYPVGMLFPSFWVFPQHSATGVKGGKVGKTK